MKAEARLNKLREGGVNVDEYIDAFVYAAAAAQQQQQQQQHRPVSQHEQQAAGATEWPESETASQAQDQVSHGVKNSFPLLDFYLHPQFQSSPKQHRKVV